MIAAMRSASAAAKPRRRAKPSVLHRFIDELLEGPLDALAFRRRLLKQHEKHVLLAVNHHIAAACPVPFQFAHRSRRRRLGVAGFGPTASPNPHAEASPGEKEK